MSDTKWKDAVRVARGWNVRIHPDCESAVAWLRA
jgi:hypothetical protein